jgi:hypothetical protein
VPLLLLNSTTPAVLAFGQATGETATIDVADLVNFAL